MSTDPNQKAIREAGGCSVVLDTLIQHMGDVSVANSAARAIGAMAIDEENRQLFVESGACEIIIDTIQIHMENQSVLTACCWCLAVLSNEPSSLPIIIDKMKSALGEKNMLIVIGIMTNISDYDPTNHE
jgi:hypothetical protein